MAMETYQQDIVAGKCLVGAEIEEAPRRIPVRKEVQVLVCGGGPAGVGAALAAGREGANVLLLERFGMLGGMWTAGLVNPLFKWEGKGYVVDALVRNLQEAGAWAPWGGAYAFDPEIMRRVLEEMMHESEVDFLYYTSVVDTIVIDGVVKGVVIESKAGREAVLADTVIDATGDGDVAARAGCRYALGRPADGQVQPMTLMFEIAGAAAYKQTSAPELYDALAEVMTEMEQAETLPFGRVSGAPWIITLPTGRSAVQTTHMYRVNPLNPVDLTRATVDGRAMMFRFMDALRRVTGFENIELIQSASTLGLREGRRILGRDTVTVEHARNGASFNDAVTVSLFHLDIHDPAPGSNIPTGRISTKPFEIPYGSLAAKDVEGLLLAGRCISGDHQAHASYRVTGTAMGIGQAAGLAAALAGDQKTPIAQFCGKTLNSALRKRGVTFLP